VEWSLAPEEDKKNQKLVDYQTTISSDGKIEFLYRNLKEKNLDDTENTGCPLMIGLQDGFVSKDDGGKNNPHFLTCLFI